MIGRVTARTTTAASVEPSSALEVSTLGHGIDGVGIEGASTVDEGDGGGDRERGEGAGDGEANGGTRGGGNGCNGSGAVEACCEVGGETADGGSKGGKEGGCNGTGSAGRG